MATGAHSLGACLTCCLPMAGTRGDEINDKGQKRTEQPVLVADLMPEHDLSKEDTYTACIPTKAQILWAKWVTHLI